MSADDGQAGENPDVASNGLSADQLRRAAEGSQLGLWTWDLTTGRVTWNARMHELTGSQKALDLPSWIETLAHPEDRAMLRSQQQGLLSPGKIPPDMSRILRPDGEVRWVVTSGEILADHNGDPCAVVGSTLDVTAQQKAVTQLEQARRMETVGHLAAGIAHNFNNMRMVIGPCLETLQAEIPQGWEQTLQDALHATDRAAAIVRQLMLISGHQSTSMRRSQRFGKVVEDVHRMCRRAITNEILLSTQIEADSEVFCEDGALEQVLTNLIFNARDALAHAQTPHPTIEVRLDGEQRFGNHWSHLTISDNGPGIPNHIQHRIFDPFFTTKIGTGTGLGLATCQAIVARHGGQLACRSQPGKTDFFLLLPSAPADAPASAAESGVAHHADASPVLRVLLIDDEPAIRRVIAASLERSGAQVATASNQADLERLLRSGVQADAVLLDRTLGTESGAALVNRLRTHLPNAKLFYFTGQSVSPEEESLVDGVVQKPVRSQALVDLLTSAVR